MAGNSSKLDASATFVLDRRYNGGVKKQHTSASSSSSKSVSRLKYRDFVPEIGSKSVETFQQLLNKANDWLRSNPYHVIKCCETVTWMSHDRKRLEDSDLMTISKRVTPGSLTHFMRGLRLWLIPRLVSGRPEVVCHRDFAPDDGHVTDSSIHQLIAKANKKFSQASNTCKILTTETVGVPVLADGGRSSKVDPTGLTEWSEPVNDDVRYSFVLRVFYVKDDVTKNKHHSAGVQIGIKDVIPQPREDGGYEGFEELTDRANFWLKDQSDIVVTNMQSLTVQGNTGPHSETGSACHYTMPGLNSDHPTEFFRILRIAFVKPLGGDLLLDSPIIFPFTFRTFAPEMLRWKDRDSAATGSGSGSAGCSSSSAAAAAGAVPDHGQCRMERMKETFAKALVYLRTTGVDVISAETVTNPLQFYSEEAAQLQSPEEVAFLLTLRLFVVDQANGFNTDLKRSSVVSSSKGGGRGSPGGGGPDDPALAPDHPGPIFLRNVVTRRYKYRWLAVAIFAVTCMTVIVVLSVVYSNK